jgi:DNA-directed RNA polymerase I subunit RPA49
MAGEKRKRDSDGESLLPRKKHAFAPQHDKIQVSVTTEDESKLPPIIAVPSAIRIPEQLAFRLYMRSLTDGKRADQKLLLHTSEHPRLDYSGDEHFGNGADALLDHYVGVYNPETGKLELHKAKRVRVTTSLRPTQQQLDEMKQKREYQTVRF